MILCQGQQAAAAELGRQWFPQQFDDRRNNIVRTPNAIFTGRHAAYRR
jgi:hypothetical protein